MSTVAATIKEREVMRPIVGESDVNEHTAFYVWTAVIHNRSSIEVGDLAVRTSTSSSSAFSHDPPQQIVILTRTPRQQDYGSQQLNGLLLPGLQVVGLNGRCLVGQSSTQVQAAVDALHSNNNIVLGLCGVVARRRRPWYAAMSGLAFSTKKQAAGIALSIDPLSQAVSIARVYARGSCRSASSDSESSFRSVTRSTSQSLKAGMAVSNVNGLVVSKKEDITNHRVHKSVIKRREHELTSRLVDRGIPFVKPSKLVALDTSVDFQSSLLGEYQRLLSHQAALPTTFNSLPSGSMLMSIPKEESLVNGGGTGIDSNYHREHHITSKDLAGRERDQNASFSQRLPISLTVPTRIKATTFNFQAERVPS